MFIPGKLLCTSIIVVVLEKFQNGKKLQKLDSQKRTSLCCKEIFYLVYSFAKQIRTFYVNDSFHVRLARDRH